MEMKRILLVEDNPEFLARAKEALNQQDLLIARDYESGMSGLEKVDAVITDLFYPRVIGSSNREKGYEAIERISKGMTIPYVKETERRLKDKGVVLTPEIRASLEILGLHRSLCSDREKYSEAVVQYLATFKEDGSKKLPQILEEMLIKGAVEKYIPKKFEGLREYVESSAENQPLGYLVAEEAEKLGKPFVIATSLRHAEAPLRPILESANIRGWKLLEGKDGSKDSLEFWLKAYSTLKGGDKNGKNS